MSSVRPDDLEALETVSQNVEARDLFLRIAHLSGVGELNRFLFELSENDELDAETKAAFAEVAQDRTFLRRARRLRAPHPPDPLSRAGTARASDGEALPAARGVARMGDPGFEPGTSALSERRSNQLS